MTSELEIKIQKRPIDGNDHPHASVLTMTEVIGEAAEFCGRATRLV